MKKETKDRLVYFGKEGMKWLCSVTLAGIAAKLSDNGYSSTRFMTRNNIVYYSNDYDSAISAIVNSGMSSYYKQCSIPYVNADSSSLYYKAIISIANSDMSSYSKSNLISYVNAQANESYYHAIINIVQSTMTSYRKETTIKKL